MPIPPHEMEREGEREEREWEQRPPHEEEEGPPHRRMRPLSLHEGIHHRPPSPKPPGITHEDLADMIDAKFERLYGEIEELKRRIR